MKRQLSSRRLIKMLHRREKATIEHVVATIAGGKTEPAGTIHSPFTASGLAVEAQIRKSCDPVHGGLPIF
jgi:hypothetical protein